MQGWSGHSPGQGADLDETTAILLSNHSCSCYSLNTVMLHCCLLYPCQVGRSWCMQPYSLLQKTLWKVASAKRPGSGPNPTSARRAPSHARRRQHTSQRCLRCCSESAMPASESVTIPTPASKLVMIALQTTRITCHLNDHTSHRRESGAAGPRPAPEETRAGFV